MERLVTFIAMAVVLLHVFVTAGAHPEETCSNYPSDGDRRRVPGRPAEPDSRPWMVLVWVSCESSPQQPLEAAPLRTCEGSLVRPDWVLTAASCFPCGSLASVTVDIGLHSSDIREEMKSERTVERVGVEKIFLAPNYVFPSHENDIALLQLSKQIKNASRAIALLDCANGERVNQGKIGFSSGWGATTSHSVIDPKPLHDAHVCVWPSEVCERSAGEERLSGMICAGAVEYDELLASNVSSPKQLTMGLKAGDRVSCFVETGSPLVLGTLRQEAKSDSSNDSCDWALCGVLSFGLYCRGDADIPGFYTNICEHHDWVQATITIENGTRQLRFRATMIDNNNHDTPLPA